MTEVRGMVALFQNRRGGAGIPVVSPAYARKLLVSVKSNVVAAAVIMCGVSTPLPPNHCHLQQLQPPHPFPLSSLPPFCGRRVFTVLHTANSTPLAAVRGFVNVWSAVSPQFR